MEVEEFGDMEKVIKLEKEGHSYHCACRQIWGDGECECGLCTENYDPYSYEWIE